MTAVAPQLSAPSGQSNLNEITWQAHNAANDRRDNRHKLSAETAKQPKIAKYISTAQLPTREEEAFRTTNMIFQHAEAEQTTFQLATITQTVLEVFQFLSQSPIPMQSFGGIYARMKNQLSSRRYAKLDTHVAVLLSLHLPKILLTP